MFKLFYITDVQKENDTKLIHHTLNENDTDSFMIHMYVNTIPVIL
jgi:hypothetical protein